MAGPPAAASGPQAGPATAATPRPYAVVDIDGVVADVRHRLHHVASRPKNWRAFFAAASRDPLLAEGASVVHTLSQTCDIVWLTGRPETCRNATQQWLNRHELPDGVLLMRPSREFRPAALVKIARLRQLAAERAISVLVDDDAAVCDAATAAGYTVFRASWMPAGPELEEAQEREGRT